MISYFLINALNSSQIEQTTVATSSEFTGLVSTLIILLIVATAVALITRKLRIPYVVGLVLAGLAIPKQILPASIGLNPEVILNLFLPILIFEAAINTDISRLRSTIKPILLLAGPGVVISATVTAIFLKFGVNLAWITACAVSVILTITDTVSVIAAFRTVTVPRTLATIVEGESLFNDGVAIVLLSIITTIFTKGSFTVTEGVQQLFIAFVGGSILGLALGYLCVGLFQQLDDALSTILLTVAVSLGTFQIGTALGVSSAIAVMIAGLVIGNLGFRQTSAPTEVSLLNFWEYAGFGANTFIFLLVGIEVDPLTIPNTTATALFAIVAYQIGRVVAIYPLLYLLSFFDRPIPLRWQHVLILGNVKGSLSMALTLSLPFGLPERMQVITLVFSTVLLSLVGQGLSLSWLVKRLKLSQPSPIKQKIEILQLNLITSKSAQRELASLLESGSLPKSLYEELFASYQARIASSETELRDLYNQNTMGDSAQGDENSGLAGIYRRLYLAEKVSINEAMRKGLLSDDVGQAYLRVLNEKLLSLKEE
ncbi:cation:proton antiporter [Pseudanabaena mucicola]|uniref:Sodium:proton antiporter n=1 Tax=Pseudanabaena mucicola FACHB-723 TaxID=2692860 RepID=A0ABR7ZX99_9CYAN|nr:sodium:proton antiporter [Pseudanabaena mucicola]MBD2188410.1 sodium:proton antiporter [Pseudanabaena mucicola FACHB-723]